MDRIQIIHEFCWLRQNYYYFFLRFLCICVYTGSETYIIMYKYVTHVFNRNRNPQYFSLWQNTVSIRF